MVDQRNAGEEPNWNSSDAARLAEHVRRFTSGALDADGLRACRVPLGVYEQRHGASYMVRIRCPGGRITPAQLRVVAGIAERFGSTRLHLTTRQEVQIHQLPLAAAAPVLDALHAAGLTTRGTGGNTVRNITASVEPDRAGDGFDVCGYALALSDRLGAEPQSFSLPRKFKIAFASSSVDDVGARLNDLGFVAQRRDGVDGFAVYAAGGLGARPRLGQLLEPFVDGREALRIALAMLRLFHEHGNRENRHEARLRFLWERLGEGEFRALYARTIAQVRNEGVPDLVPVPMPFATPAAAPGTVGSAGAGRWLERYGTTGQAPGAVSVLVPIASGELGTAAALALADAVADCGDDPLRLTTRQNVLLRGVPVAGVEALYHGLRESFPLVDQPRVLAESVSCAGASTCQLGICLSHNALKAARERLAGSGVALDSLGDLRIHVSGCPNNCGRHSAADLGFSGKAKRVDGRLYPAYQIFAGARAGDAAKLAERIGEIPAAVVPEYLEAALRAYATGMERFPSFADFVEGEGGPFLRDLARRLEQSFDSSNPRAWLDWGASDQFSLDDRGAGECASG